MKAIAAMAENRAIGLRNKLPWHLPEDLRWFQAITRGHIVVMGRKTFESIGKPLSGRSTIVITSRPLVAEGVEILPDPRQLLARDDGREIFICGGAQLYAATLPWCSDLYLTRIKKPVEGDTYFPPFEHLFSSPALVRDGPDFEILHYSAPGH